MSQLPLAPIKAPTGANVWNKFFTDLRKYVTTFQKQNAVPTTADIAPGEWVIWKDATGGTLRIYANDNGTIKSVTLT